MSTTEAEIEWEREVVIPILNQLSIEPNAQNIKRATRAVDLTFNDAVKMLRSIGNHRVKSTVLNRQGKTFYHQIFDVRGGYCECDCPGWRKGGHRNYAFWCKHAIAAWLKLKEWNP